jgi:tetratricopeptide (TPR) repeat protein
MDRSILPPKLEQGDKGLSALLRDLRAELGEFGYQWLAACAVYPGLHWNLTVFLGAGLARANNVPRPDEDAHLALARLPWFRKGSMPDELRLALIDELSPSNLKATREALKRLFHLAMKLPAGTSEPAYEINVAQTAPPGWRDIFRRLRATAEPDAPIHDAIFVRYMMGRRPSAAGLRLDRALVRLFGAHLAGWLDLPTAVAFSVALATVATLWFGMGWLILSSPISDSKVTVPGPGIASGGNTSATYEPVGDVQKELNNAAEAAAEAAAKAAAETATKAARDKAAAEAEVKAARGKAAAEAKAARTNSAGDRLAQRAREAQTLLPPQSVAGQTAGADDAVLCDRAGADPDAGIPACTRLIEHPSAGTNVPAVYNNRGVAKVRKGDLDSAVKDFTSALDRNPAYADAFKNRGIARQMQGGYDAAIADFNRALRLDAKSPDLYNARGSAFIDKREYDLAIADFDKAISLDPNYKKAFVNRGLAYQAKRQLDRATADFDMFVRLAPNEPLGYINRASVRMDKADLKDAIDDYNQAIRLDPSNSGAYTRRGEAWRLQGDLERSLADHNKAIALNPNDKETYNNRALAFKDQGKLDEAIADCDQAIMLDPAYDFAYATRGLIRRLKGDLGGSLMDLNKAVTLDPRSPIAVTFRGDTLRESENTNGAMADFNKAILLLPDFVAAYTGRGLTYEKMGNLANAKADFEKALSLSADFDAGIARPARDVARTRLAALAKAAAEAAAEAARAKAARVKAATENAAPKEPSSLPTIEPATLVPDDIQKALYHRGHALLIGVSRYTGGWPQLPSVTNDLQNLKEGLAPYFETVETVQSPSVADIRAKMRAFLLDQWNRPGERLFIYYSGHGFTDFNQVSRQSDGYITGSDTPLYKDDGRAVANALPFTEVDSWSRQTKAKHVLMVFDSAFSGSLFQTKGSAPEPTGIEFDGVRKMLGRPMRYYITAGRQNEEVSADSTFAKLLLRGLRGEADVHHQGIISAEELGSYLYHEVPRYSQRPQTPQYASIANATLSEGQFFFLIVGKAAVEAEAPAARAKQATENAAPKKISSLPPPEPATLVPDDIQKLLSHHGHALLIGVSDYKSGWGQLLSVKKDLQDLKVGLEPHFETVDTVPNPITGPSPTVAELRARIHEFLLGRWNRPEERLFIYYSGHGFTRLDSTSGEKIGYITGSDTPLYDSTPGKAIENALQFTDIDDFNRQAKALHVLVVFDSCFSGYSFQTLRPPKEATRHDFEGVRRMLHKPVRYYITACGQNERETADSTFATVLLRGLGGEADSFHGGIISTDDLVPYLSREVPKTSERPQTPQFRSVLYNSKPTPPPRTPQPAQTVEPPKPVNLLRDKVEPVEAVAQVVLTALPLIVFLAWLGIRWNRRSLWLERRVSGEVPELDSIRLPRESRWLFTDAGFRSTAQNLRRHRRAATTDLHIKQTIEATVQRAGLFIPVYKDRQLTPEYLFLIEEVSADDHVARFGDEALDRLEEEGGAVERVYFSRDPRLCFRNDEVRTPISLTELAARTADHRLVVIGTADSFFHMTSGRPERWLSTLELWSTRVMLSSLPLRSWSANELALLERGFSLATASPKGFEALGDYISAVEEAPGGELLEGTLVTR